MSEYVEPHDIEAPSSTQTEKLESDPAFQKLQAKLALFQTKLEGSEFIEECYKSLDKIRSKVANIRCLALGSPSQSNNALYQLAFTELIAKNLKIAKVSFYDPVLTSSDIYLLESKLGHKVEAKEPEKNKTLLFLPHAPLELTNVILNQVEPSYFLGNDIVAHTDRYTKAKLHEKYPTISLLVRLIETKNSSKDAKDTKDTKDGKSEKETPNEFTSVRRRKKNKNVFVEPKIDYDFTQSYFQDLDLYRYSESFQKDSEWGNSFSDLALHIITPHEKSTDSSE